MAFTEITYEVENGIGRIVLNRPEALNAVTVHMLEELKTVFSEIDQDDDVRVAVVTGAGDVFCAGADISEGARAFDPEAHERWQGDIDDIRDPGGQLSLAVFACKKPIIAAINGHAVGIGITMTLPMDIRVAAQDARIGFVFTRRGVVPEACSSWFLPRIVGITKAAEWVLTGRTFQARTEAGSGLFNYVVPRAEVLSKALSLAEEITRNTAAVSVGLSKALLWRGMIEKTPHAVHLIDSKCFFWSGMQPDAYEGIVSFLEKRPPRFSMKPSSDMPDFYPWWDRSA